MRRVIPSTMTTPLCRRRRFLAGSVVTTALILGLVPVALGSSSPAKADTEVSCNTPVTSAPTGPATISAASTAYGRVLVLGGSGPKARCSLYVLTSDQLHALTGARFACSNTKIPQLGNPAPTCANALWPALLTHGAPIARKGVNPHLLRTVTRTDVIPGTSVHQVTYAGLPLYFFFMDEMAGETDGANLFDNVVNPTGIWYLVHPHRGRIAPGRAQLQLESFQAGTTQQKTVLAASMNDGFRLFPDAPFPVYTFSSHRGHKSACTGRCAVDWPPLLTSERPEAIGYAVDQHSLGTIVRRDGSHQVTYHGKPLYLFKGDAYIGTLPPPFNGPGGINGDGASANGGTFRAISLS
jgi:predicted lipoprotein with Yx(FWY)xxD motif